MYWTCLTQVCRKLMHMLFVAIVTWGHPPQNTIIIHPWSLMIAGFQVPDGAVARGGPVLLSRPARCSVCGSPTAWALDPHGMGSRPPRHGVWTPTTWALDPHGRGSGPPWCPRSVAYPSSPPQPPQPRPARISQVSGAPHPLHPGPPRAPGARTAGGRGSRQPNRPVAHKPSRCPSAHREG